MNINKLISEAVRHEIPQRESVGGFHAIFETVGEKVLRGLNELMVSMDGERIENPENQEEKKKKKRKFDKPSLKDTEKEYEKNKSRFEKSEIPPNKAFRNFRNLPENERQELTKEIIRSFIPFIFETGGDFARMAFIKNQNNQKLALEILLFVAGDKTNRTLGKILNYVFDIYLDTIITYYFSGKKPLSITGNKQIDTFILKEIKKRLLSDLRNNDIPKWFEEIPLFIKKEVLNYSKGNTSINLAKGFFSDESEEENIFEQELENNKDKTKNRKAVLTATAIIKRAQIVFSDLKPNDKVLDEILDLIANMLIRKNTDLNETLTNIIAREVQVKVDRLKNGKLALSNIVGLLADNNLLGSGGSLIQAVFGFNRETMSLIRQELSKI